MLLLINLIFMKPYISAENLDSKTQSWLQKIKPFNQHRITLNSHKSALLVIDMQKFFLDPQSPTFTIGGSAILPGLKRLIQSFRDAGRPVIYTSHVHHPGLIDAGIMDWWWEGMCLEGSEDSRVHEEIAPLASDKVITKHRYSAFYNTDLETVLRVMKIEDLVVTGVLTNLCCESTARDAYFRDYRVFFLADGTATINERMHLASLLNISYGFGYVTTVEAIIEEM